MSITTNQAKSRKTNPDESWREVFIGIANSPKGVFVKPHDLVGINTLLRCLPNKDAADIEIVEMTTVFYKDQPSSPSTSIKIKGWECTFFSVSTDVNEWGIRSRMSRTMDELPWPASDAIINYLEQWMKELWEIGDPPPVEGRDKPLPPGANPLEDAYADYHGSSEK